MYRPNLTYTLWEKQFKKSSLLYIPSTRVVSAHWCPYGGQRLHWSKVIFGPNVLYEYWMFEKPTSTEMWLPCGICVAHFSSKLINKCISGYITLHPNSTLFGGGGVHYLTWKIALPLPTKSFEDSRTKDTKYFCIQLNKWELSRRPNECLAAVSGVGWGDHVFRLTALSVPSAITATSYEDLLLA